MNFPKLSLLPPNALDDPNLRRRTIEVLNALIAGLRLEEGPWTPVIRGSGTAGTYEITTSQCRYTRIGRRIFLDLKIITAGAVTGGGTGYMQITGVPYAKAASVLPIGAASLDAINWTNGANQALAFETSGASSALIVIESNDSANVSNLPISVIGANEGIYGSICYETDDP